MTAPLTVKSFADAIGMSPSTVYNMVKDGELAVLRRPGCHIRIPASELDRYWEENLCPANTKAQNSSSSRTATDGTSATPLKAERSTPRQAALTAARISRDRTLRPF